MKMVAKNLEILLFQLCLGAFFLTSTNPLFGWFHLSLHQISPIDMLMRATSHFIPHKD
jgi:hypothetical protein